MDYEAVNRYQRNVVKTAKEFPNEQTGLLYYTTGLVGECCEVADVTENSLDWTEIEKELGDVLWYTGRLADLFFIKMSDIVFTKDESHDYFDAQHLSNALCARAGKVSEMLKKHVRDGRQIDTVVLVQRLADVYHHVERIAARYGLTVERIMEINIEKLAARYPKGYFDAADAIARADGQVLRE